MLSFYWTCNETALNILGAISLGLGLEEDFLLKFHSGHNSQLRLLHYPPVPAEVLNSSFAERMPAHTDWGSITMLFQDDCGGLEVENPHEPGQFICARPEKNAIVMNIGDLLQRWSNGTIHLCYNLSYRVLRAAFLGRSIKVDLAPGCCTHASRSFYRSTTNDTNTIFNSILR